MVKFIKIKIVFAKAKWYFHSDLASTVGELLCCSQLSGREGSLVLLRLVRHCRLMRQQHCGGCNCLHLYKTAWGNSHLWTCRRWGSTACWGLKQHRYLHIWKINTYEGNWLVSVKDLKSFQWGPGDLRSKESCSWTRPEKASGCSIAHLHTVDCLLDIPFVIAFILSSIIPGYFLWWPPRSASLCRCCPCCGTTRTTPGRTCWGLEQSWQGNCTGSNVSSG